MQSCHLYDKVGIVRDHHELGECRSSQQSGVRCLEVSYLKLLVFRMKIFPSPKGYRKSDLIDKSHCCTRNYAMRGSPGHSIDLDNPNWWKVFKNRMFRELPPSIRTRMSFTSLTMRITMRGYQPGFGTKSRWSLRSKVIWTSNHFRYSWMVGETAMTSQAVSFYFLLDA
jgi:hypothetical protein